MRKHLTLLVAALMLASLVLVACGGGETAPADTAEETAGEAEEVEEAVDEADEAADEAAEGEDVEAAEEEMAEEMADEADEEVAEVDEAMEEDSGEPVTIKWFVGLGTGGNDEQIAMQNEVVERFNASQDDIVLQIEIVQNDVGVDTLATAMASGDAPDIVGPVGTAGANAFYGSWLDLQPLVDSTGYDLTQFPEAAVDTFRVEGELVSLPFASYPSFIYFNRDLFDEAGLPYPPQEYGAPYIDADGNELPWTIETMSDLARQLTVDSNGSDATMDGFDASAIEQFGFVLQWVDTPGNASVTIFGADSFIDEDGNAQIPEQWAEGYAWIQDAIFGEQPFMASAAYEASDLLAAPNAFGSGNVAMAYTHLWFTCCLGDAADFEWDIAAVPANGDTGVTTSKLHADTFRILETTEHPEEAFEVLTYLIGTEAAPDLLSVYGGMSARPDEAADFFAGLDEQYPFGVNWQVAVDSFEYSDVPNHESYLPNFNRAVDRTTTFYNLLKTEPVDLEAELETLQSDLQVIFDEAE